MSRAGRGVHRKYAQDPPARERGLKGAFSSLGQESARQATLRSEGSEAGNFWVRGYRRSSGQKRGAGLSAGGSPPLTEPAHCPVSLGKPPPSPPWLPHLPVALG